MRRCTLDITDIRPPTSSDIAYFTDEERAAAIPAYLAWSTTQLERYHVSMASVVDIIGRVEALHALPFSTRVLRTAMDLQFLTETHHWLEDEPNTFPAVPVLLDVLGDVLFLRAEADVCLARQHPAPHPTSASRLFSRVCSAYAGAQDILCAQINRVAPNATPPDGARYDQWVGFVIAHAQSVANLLRATVRTVSHQIIEHAPDPPPPHVRAAAYTQEVLALQHRFPGIVIDGDVREAAAASLRIGELTIQVRFGDPQTAGAALLNTATLSALLGNLDSARAYARVILALHAQGKPIAGIAEARDTIACADRFAP